MTQAPAPPPQNEAPASTGPLVRQETPGGRGGRRSGRRSQKQKQSRKQKQKQSRKQKQKQSRKQRS